MRKPTVVARSAHLVARVLLCDEVGDFVGGRPFCKRLFDVSGRLRDVRLGRINKSAASI